MNEGRLKSDRMNYAQAIVDFDMAIKFNPANWRAYQAKANAERQIKEFSKSIEYYTTALQFHRDTTSLVGRAEAYTNIGLDSLAILDYSEAIKLQPDNYWLYYNRAKGWLAIADYKAAVDDFSSCISLDSTNSRAYNMRSRSYYALGRYKNSISDFIIYQKLGGRDKAAYYYASFSYLGLLRESRTNVDNAYRMAREYEMLGGQKNVNTVYAHILD